VTTTRREVERSSSEMSAAEAASERSEEGELCMGRGEAIWEEVMRY
jgi:hypothetical protein